MKILVADRDGLRAEEIAMQLRAQNAGCHIACIAQKENLSDAVRWFEPDVVVVDMARPDRDRLDSVRALHNEAL